MGRNVETVHSLTRIPRVPDARTRRRASASRGPPYGQYGTYPGKFGGRIWQVGPAAAEPPTIRTTAWRSTARFSARRTRTSSKGGIRVLRNTALTPLRTLARVRPAY